MAAIQAGVAPLSADSGDTSLGSSRRSRLSSARIIEFCCARQSKAPEHCRLTCTEPIVIRTVTSDQVRTSLSARRLERCYPTQSKRRVAMATPSRPKTSAGAILRAAVPPVGIVAVRVLFWIARTVLLCLVNERAKRKPLFHHYLSSRQATPLRRPAAENPTGGRQ